MLFILGHLVEIIFWQGYLLNVNFWITNIKHLLSEEVGEYFNAYFGVETIWEVNKSKIKLFSQEQSGGLCRSSQHLFILSSQNVHISHLQYFYLGRDVLAQLLAPASC